MAQTLKNNEELQQESNATNATDIANLLEIAIMVVLLKEIKNTLENENNKANSLNNIRKGVEKNVALYLPLLIDASKKAIKSNYDQLSFKGKKPSYNDKFAKESEDYFKKYIKTKGTNFVVGKNQKLPQFFTTFIEKEVKDIVDGTKSINQVIEKAVKQLADSGLKVIDYDSGVTRQIDVFVRQQMLYAQKQSTQDIRDRFAEENEITIFEFDAHPNARPSHKIWQGKRYDITGKEYPTLDQLTHGEHNDYGCRHRAYPVYNVSLTLPSGGR